MSERSANTWGWTFAMLAVAYGLAFGFILLGSWQGWATWLCILLGCLGFMLGLMAGIITLAAKGYDIQ
jgi:hypothetical protein